MTTGGAAGPGRQTLAAAVIAICLIAGASPRLVGDGREYLAQALQFTRGTGPAITEADIEPLRAAAAAAAPELAEWDLRQDAVADGRGRWDFRHFWLYSLLATPFVALAGAGGVSPLTGFTLFNLTCLLLAVRVVLPRLGAPLTALVFLGPGIWWVDKAHTEAFTLSMLTIAMVSLRDRPWWAFLALGLAGAQNPPISAVLAIAGAITLISRPAVIRDSRVSAGLMAGLALAAAHPAYAFARHGVWSLLAGTTPPGLPVAAEWLAVPLDPVIGLAPNFPALLVVLLVSLGVLLRRRERAAGGWPELVVAAGAASVFLAAFARTANFHHGGTPSMSRYALWLVPLCLPVLWQAREAGGAGWRRFVTTTSTLSAFGCIFIFHPRVAENGREPTWTAQWLWTQHPGWHDPLPEVFAETLARTEHPELPGRTAGCEKILTVGREAAGVWPVPCYPADLPPHCRLWGTACYANRTGTGYDIRRAPGRRELDARIARELVWPAEAEPHVRRLFNAADWTSLHLDDSVGSAVRFTANARAWALTGPGRLLLVLQVTGADAEVRLRPPGPVSGQLYEARSGRALSMYSHAGGSEELWRVPLPDTDELLLLVLRTETGP